MKVKFIPQNIELEISSNQTILDLAKQNGIAIKSVCGGKASCAECRVQIKHGEYNVLSPSPTELSLIGTAHFVDHSRLACQLRCFGDVTIDLNEQLDKQSRPLSAKKARGGAASRQRMDGDEESYAVMGSMILDDSGIDPITVPENMEDIMERQAEERNRRDELRRLKQRKDADKQSSVTVRKDAVVGPEEDEEVAAVIQKHGDFYGGFISKKDNKE